MNIYNFANRQLCEYQSIFPNVAVLLDHLLFTNGNGYEYDEKLGLPVSFENQRAMSLDKWPEMTDAEWDKLIQDCHAKERRFAEQYARGKPVDEVELAEDCANYKRVSVTGEMFTEDSLFWQIRDHSQAKRLEAFKSEDYPSFVRPYPLSPGYAMLFELSEKTPGWFLQIAFNLCNAWVRFLDEEIKYNNVWIKPSLRPKLPNHESRAAAMTELFAMIKEDADYDGWLDKPHAEPEADYADLTWTTRVRDQLAEQAQRIGQLLVACNKFKVGDKVVVKVRDPFWTYQGTAEPKPGMKCVVSDINVTEPAAFGKIAVKFNPEELGYERREDDGSDESITLYIRPWILGKK